MIMDIVNVGTVGHCNHNVSNEHKALYAEIQILRAKVDVLVEALSTIRHDAYMDSSYNKTVIEIYEVADKAIMAYDKLSEVKHDTK